MKAFLDLYFCFYRRKSKSIYIMERIPGKAEFFSNFHLPVCYFIDRKEKSFGGKSSGERKDIHTNNSSIKILIEKEKQNCFCS